jgi:hypothetical protein
MSRGEQSLILMLHQSISLWHIRGGEVMLCTFIDTVGGELLDLELTTVVQA